MTTRSNTPIFSKEGAKSGYVPCIRTTKNQMGLKPHLIQVSLHAEVYGPSSIVMNACKGGEPPTRPTA